MRNTAKSCAALQRRKTACNPICSSKRYDACSGPFIAGHTCRLPRDINRPGRVEPSSGGARCSGLWRLNARSLSHE